MQAVHDEPQARLAMKDIERIQIQEQVRAQMNRMLETHHFKNSRRYPALLRFIVEETLEGRGEYLKERLIGVHVFERPADYDTAADPIVRVNIAEVRKRIAQYYHDEEHDAEIRIELLPGRYAPEFRSRRDLSAVEAPAATASTVALVVPPVVPASLEPAPAARVAAPTAAPIAAPRGRRWYVAGALACLLALSLWIGLSSRPSAVEAMWTPVLASDRSVLFCLPTDVGKKPGSPEIAPGAATTLPPRNPALAGGGLGAGKTFLDYETLGENVVYSDVLATMRMADVLSAHHHDYHLRLNVSTTLEDLRQGPAVLVGGLDNPWTMRSLAPLRFHFAGSDEESWWIADAQNPASHAWSLDLKQQYLAVNRDYAIVARLHNEQTGQPQVIVAGIGMSGTAAAGEFVADERHMRELRERIGPGFRDRDFEVVLSTDVVNGIAGSAKIVAVTTW